MGEGLFNQTGLDLLGITTIAPLFLSSFGASLGLIGMLTTLQGATHSIVPLLSGGFAARAKSKRRVSIVGNGIARTMMFLIPASLLLGLPNSTVIGVFIATFTLLVLVSPITGLIWNYLLNDCLSTLDRPKLLGVIFAASGIVSLGTSNLIKVIRDSTELPDNMKYFYIFGLAGLFLSTSVLWFLPLKESRCETTANKVFSVKEYLNSLTMCFKNKILSGYFYVFAATACAPQFTEKN